MRELLRYARPHRRTLTVGGLLALLASAAGLAQPLVAKAVIEALQSGSGLVRPVVLLSALVVASALVGAGSQWLLGRTSERIVLGVRRGLAERLVRLRVAQLDRADPGDLISRATADSTLLRSATTTALIDLVTGVLGFIGAIALMAWLDLRLFGVSMSVLALLAVVLGLVLPRIRQAWKAAQEAVGRLGAALDRALGAPRTVKASGAEAREAGRISDAANIAYQAGLRGVRYEALVGIVTGLSVQVPFLVVLGAGGALVAAGELGVASLVAFLLYLFYLVGPIGQIVGGLTTVQQGLGAVDRLRTVQQMPIEDDVPAGEPVAGPAGSAASPTAVRFTDVHFTYPDREPVLHGVSFHAPGPGLTAIVGPSGAGKTTIFSLLMRFYDVDRGSIELGGHSVAQLPRPQLRRRLGYVEQDAPVLSGTLAGNLRYAAPDVSDESVREVLGRTRLDGLVAQLPDGLETLVGTRGVLLSGGERQRLAIARALLRRPEVLLLDEATSQLDARNEAALREVVQEVARSCAVLVVAHRLSTVTAADRIVVLEAGVVRASGTHEELLEADPLYRELAATQLLTSEPAA